MKDGRVVSWIKEEKIAIITINNLPVNTLNMYMIQQLADALKEIENDVDVVAVIITGTGEKAFVAGGDIKEFPDWIGKGERYAEMKSLGLQHPLNKVERLSKPTIAAINGLALGEVVNWQLLVI